MWARLSHMLVNFIKITSNKVKFKWTKAEQDTFDEIKWIVACDNFLIYPDFNEGFKIHTDATNFQLGAVISQKGKTINLYSRKLTEYQKRYRVIEGELPGIIETLKEFRIIVLEKILRI